MDGMLSQEEINALLGGADGDSGAESNAGQDAAADTDMAASSAAANSEERLSPEEGDALGEIANISMGTAATTLSVLINNRVEITTPQLSYVTVEDLKERNQAPCVFIYIGYRTGLEGKNVLVLKEQDVKVITDLMMGGDGSNTDVELSELHLSAISEAMNQMMGSAATSMSTMINDMVDISPPTSIRVDFDDDAGLEDVLKDMVGKLFAQVSFKMVIGDLIDSEIIQLYPIPFARMIYEKFKDTMGGAEPEPEPEPTPVPQPQPQPAAAQPMAAAQPQQAPQPAMQQMPQQQMPPMGAMPMYAMPPQDLNIQPAQFQSFMPTQNLDGIAPENIDLIMDVPLEVTVELGRTSKSIKEILDFSPGTVIELDKLAGEPIDVLVNGKFVAKGEVVVIEENFAIRVTEIIKD